GRTENPSGRLTTKVAWANDRSKPLILGHLTHMELASPSRPQPLPGAEGSRPAVRLFASDFLERLTRTSVITLVLVWVPLFSLSLVAGLWLGRYSPLQSLIIIVAGALWW